MGRQVREGGKEWERRESDGKENEGRKGCMEKKRECGNETGGNSRCERLDG